MLKRFAVLALVLLSGCGGDDDEQKSSAPAKPKQAEKAAPAALVGEYSMALKKSDLPPNPPRELTDQAENWTLKIANSGGVDNGRLFSLINDKLGQLEGSKFGVVGNRVLLHDQECAVAPAPVESEYEFKQTGDKLEFTEVKNGCEDKVSLTLITANPWTRKN